MDISDKGLIEIISHEGICLEPYLDSVGVWTIGIGQTKSDDIDPKTMGKLTLQQAIDLFKRKIKSYTRAVDALGLNLTQYQYDALTSLCYNFGAGNLQKLCHGRTIEQIGDAIMLYTKPPEITDRRRKEQRLFKTGQYSNTNGKVLVFPVKNNHPRYSEGYMVDVRPYFTSSPVPTSKPGMTVTPADHAKVGGAVIATTAAAGAAAAAQQGITATEIILWIAGLSAVAIAAFIIGYRIIKGHWPWTSTGNQSQEVLPLSPQPLAKSLELASAQLGLRSAELLAKPSPLPSEPSQPRKPSARRSQKTRPRRKSSSSSKKIAGRKSSPKRKSKSKS